LGDFLEKPWRNIQWTAEYVEIHAYGLRKKDRKTFKRKIAT